MRQARATWLPFLLALVAAGLFLRWWQLGAQLLIDDEWHALRVAMDRPWTGIINRFGVADHSIPLTLLYRVLHVHGLLSEWSMRLPLVVAGSLVLALPWWLRRELPRATVLAWTGLLAVSPLLVYFSRTARPYALLALLGPLALIAFVRWQRGQGRHWLPVWLGAAAFATWLHPLSLVFTGWPFVHYGLSALRRWRVDATEARARLLRLLAAGTAFLLVLAILLALPLTTDWAALSGKAGTTSLGWSGLWRALRMLAGTGVAPVAVAWLALVLHGSWRLWQRDREQALVWLGAAVAGAGVIALLRPAWVAHPLVMTRYMAPVVPLLLLAAAEGVAGLVARLPRPAAPVAVAAMLAALVLAGPLPTWMHWPNQFMGHLRYSFEFAPQDNPYELLAGPVRLPGFLQDLAARPAGSLTVVVAPALVHSNFEPAPWWQPVHRQFLRSAVLAPACDPGTPDAAYQGRLAAGVALRQVLPLDEVLRQGSAAGDYLLLLMRSWSVPPDWPIPWPDMEACAQTVENLLGPPVWSDAQARIFRLAAPAGQAPAPARR